MNSFGEATYWHNHPDLARLAQNMREQLEQQRVRSAVDPQQARKRSLAANAVNGLDLR